MLRHLCQHLKYLYENVPGWNYSYKGIKNGYEIWTEYFLYTDISFSKWIHRHISTQLCIELIIYGVENFEEQEGDFIVGYAVIKIASIGQG